MEKKKNDIQKFRPGRSALQWHCGLRLFFENIYSTYIHYCTLLYMVCSTFLRPLFIFLFDKWPQTTLFEVNC